MPHVSQRYHKLLACTLITTLAVLLLAYAPASAAAKPGVTAADSCGTVPAHEARKLAELSDPSRISGSTTLERLEDAVARHSDIAEIFERYGDRRGLFSSGLDAVEQSAVRPLQRNPQAFFFPEWAHEISHDLLERYLANLHAHLTDAPTEPHWEQYFALATDCAQSGAWAAMAGYNAHLTVDLAHSVAATRTAAHHVRDYYLLVDTIAQHGDDLIDRTLASYGADLGPLWRFYFVGEGLDALVGEGVATKPMLRAADVGYNTLTLAHGMQLQDSALRADAQARITELWRTADLALGILAMLRAL